MLLYNFSCLFFWMKELIKYIFSPKENVNQILSKSFIYKRNTIIYLIIILWIIYPVVDYIFEYNTLMLGGFKFKEFIDYFPKAFLNFISYFVYILSSICLWYFIWRKINLNIKFFDYIFVILVWFYLFAIFWLFLFILGPFLILFLWIFVLICLLWFVDVFVEWLTAFEKEKNKKILIFIITICSFLIIWLLFKFLNII